MEVFSEQVIWSKAMPTRMVASKLEFMLQNVISNSPTHSRNRGLWIRPNVAFPTHYFAIFGTEMFLSWMLEFLTKGLICLVLMLMQGLISHVPLQLLPQLSQSQKFWKTMDWLLRRVRLLFSFSTFQKRNYQIIKFTYIMECKCRNHDIDCWHKGWF